MNTWQTKHTVEEQELSVGFSLWLISGTLTVGWFHDANADCDADGNRGHDVTAEDERRWEIKSAAIDIDGEWGTPLVGENIPASVVAAAETWAETYEPNDYGEGPEEDDEPDYDPVEEEERRERRMDFP